MEIQQASNIFNLFVSESSEDVFVVARVADKLPFEEGDVDDGGIKVDKLEDEDFEGEIIVEIWLSSVHLWKNNMKTTMFQCFIKSTHPIS